MMAGGKAIQITGNAPLISNTPDTARSKVNRKWHKRGRLHYAVTPRFAPTSTGN